MPARYETLAAWINERGWEEGAELGVFAGRTHRYLVENCPGLKLLIGVDVWDSPSFAEGPTKSGEKCHCTYCNETRADRKAATPTQMRERMEAFAREHAASDIQRMTTVEAALHEADETLDFVFIDGDHSTEGVSADIAAWRPKLKPGGWMIGHDWNMASVRNAVYDTLRPAKVSEYDDHLWVVEC
jgi:hypothetical protein